MKNCLTHFSISLVLTAYTVVGVVGHTEQWVTFLENRSHQQLSPTSRSPAPVDTRPVWSQQKHVPAAVRISLTPIELPATHDQEIRQHVVCCLIIPEVFVPQQDVDFQHTSRAPPLA